MGILYFKLTFDIIYLGDNMREYMREHIELIDNYIKGKKHVNLNDVINDHLKKISIFQHERLIHLLVTLFYAIITLFFLVLTIVSYLFIPISIIVMIFLILYIYHYFYLEKGVQYMYKQYDILKGLGK